VAKRKKSKDQRAKAKQSKADDAMLHRYARFCYHKARAEKAHGECLPMAAMVPKDGQRHNELIGMAEKRLRAWFAGLKGMQPMARRKIKAELAIGYTSPGVPPKE